MRQLDSQASSITHQTNYCAPGSLPVYQAQLANGLSVWCLPRAGSPSVAVVLVLGAGSRYETTENNGISHFVEHMVFTGTEKWDEKEIKEIITRRGGRWNGWTDEELTVYYAHLAAGDLETALEWLSEIVFHPIFPPDKVEKERNIIFQERWGRYGWLINTLDALGFGYDLGRQISRALFPDSTINLRVAGEDSSLEKIGREMLLAYYSRHYVPANAALIVAGGVEPTHVFARAEERFGGIVGGARPPQPHTPALPASGPYSITVRGPTPTEQVVLVIGARTVGRTHPDSWPLRVVAEVIEDDLREELRYRRGLVYGIHAYNATYDDIGYFGISTRCDARRRAGVLRTIMDYLDRLRRSGIEPSRLAQIKTTLKGRWALSDEDNEGWAVWLSRWALILPAGAPVPDYPSFIDAVTENDILRVMNTYFVPEHSFVGQHLPVATVAGAARAGVAILGIATILAGSYALWRRLGRKRAIHPDRGAPIRTRKS